MKKLSKITLSLAAFALSSMTAMAETGSGTANINATPPGITITEIQPYEMTLERLPGATISGSFQLSEWATYLAQDPASTVQEGCLKIQAETSRGVDISVIGVGQPTAPGGSTMSWGNTPKVMVSTSNTDCASAIAATGTLMSVGASPISDTTSATGELYIAWGYNSPSSGTGVMTVDAWEEGTYSATVDFQIDYQ